MAKPFVSKLYKEFVASVSFSSSLRKMRRELNAKIDLPDTIAPPPPSHPQGVNRWFKKRRVSIAESYLMVVRDLDSSHSRARLEALRVLADVAFHARTLDYPLNTARVQMALIKEVTKHRNNKRRQLELLYDFSASEGGRHQVIRKLCDELNIVELPENGMRLRDFDYGWDDHVHDTATSGRKNATQLLIDAFIKGISRLTVAYGSAADVEMMEEAVEAGAILGIQVRLGLEFSMLVDGERFHFMAVFPDIESAEEVRAFFERNVGNLASFFEGLERNKRQRLESVRRLLERFNAESLQELNGEFEGDPSFSVPRLSMEGLNAHISTASINRLHVAEYLYSLYKPALANRYLYLKAQGLGSEASKVKKALKRLTPDSLLAEYFSGPRVIDYRSVFDDIAGLSDLLRAAGCRLKVLHPIEFGPDKAEALLRRHGDAIDQAEVYNTQDCFGRDSEIIVRFAKFLDGYNRERASFGTRICEPVCGSDATGRNPKIPGMGFITQGAITGKRRRAYIGRHVTLPPFVSQLIAGDAVIGMGKIIGNSRGGDVGEASDASVGPIRLFRYLNPSLKNGILVAIGFLVANRFIGPGYAALWLGITGFRNSIADLVSRRGVNLGQWKWKSIDFGNVAQSLFWTGFSVPILGFIKANFDAVWPGEQSGMLFNLAKFFCISFANGLYLASHNTLRGFDKKVVRANFFRSVLAWPFATLFAPVGNLLGVPSIVQAKIWSDFVAGFIEGGGKYFKVLRLREHALAEILPKILSKDEDEKYTAVLDLVYLFREEPRTRSSLKTMYGAASKLSPARRASRQSYQSLPLDALKRAISDPALPKGLARHVIAKYEEEMASDLVDLAADALPAMGRWLDSLGPNTVL